MKEIKQFYSQNFDPIKRKKGKYKIFSFSLHRNENRKIYTEKIIQMLLL